MGRLRQVAFPPLRGTILESILESCVVVHEELDPGACHASRPLELLTIFVTDAGRSFTGCQHGRIEQQPGRLVVVAAGTALSQHVLDQPWRSHYLMLGGALTASLNEHLRALPLRGFMAPRQPLVNQIVIDTVETVIARPRGWEWRVLQHLAELIGQLHACVGPQVSQLDHRIALAIDAEPERPWTVPAVAQAMDLTSRTLQRRWRQAHRMPLSRFILTQRLRHARMLLQKNQSLVSIARRLHFSTPFHLSRAFKRVFGIPPSQVDAGDSGRIIQ